MEWREWAAIAYPWTVVGQGWQGLERLAGYTRRAMPLCGHFVAFRKVSGSLFQISYAPMFGCICGEMLSRSGWLDMVDSM